MDPKMQKLCFITVAFLAVVGMLLIVRSMTAVKITSPDFIRSTESGLTTLSNNFNFYMEQYVVIFEYFKDGNETRIPCIGVYLANVSIISTDSCLEPYRWASNLRAVIGFDSDQEPIKIESHKRHHDYVKLNNLNADIMYLKLATTVPNNPIKLENNVNRTLSDYTIEPYNLFRINIDTNYKPSKKLVSVDEIKYCGPSIDCLSLKDNEHGIGSLLVAQIDNEYLLLGIQQNRTLENNFVPYTKLPLYAKWVQSTQPAS